MNVFVMICGKFLIVWVTLVHLNQMDRLKTDKGNAKVMFWDRIVLCDYTGTIYYENKSL